MENNFTDIFELKKVHSASKEINSNTNFFLNDYIKDYHFELFSQNEIVKHLNDYDFNLLKDGAYNDIDNNMLKLEYKILRVENELKAINSQLQAAEAINDHQLIKSIIERKKSLEDDYEILLSMYNNKNISAKLSDTLINFWNNIFKTNKIKKNLFYELIEKYSAKMPKFFISLIELRNSLNKLENINKSVDKLINMNIPYGENNDKYRQLSSYIIKANAIQSEIVKNIKK